MAVWRADIDEAAPARLSPLNAAGALPKSGRVVTAISRYDDHDRLDSALRA